MKALTLWQPWASAIALQQKHFETRSWPTKYRGPLAIHAATRLNNADEALFIGLLLKLHSLDYGSSASFPVRTSLTDLEFSPSVIVPPAKS